MASPSAVRDTSRFSKSAPFSTFRPASATPRAEAARTPAPVAQSASGHGRSRLGDLAQRPWPPLVAHSAARRNAHCFACIWLPSYPHDGHATAHCQAARRMQSGLERRAQLRVADGVLGAKPWGRAKRCCRRARSSSARACRARMPRAQARQPAWPRHRRHRHRQDRVAAGDGRGLLRGRRAGVRRRHQGRPVRHLGHGRAEGRARQARQGDRPRRLVQHARSRPCSGTCSASRATRSAPPCRRWGRCCSRA